MSITIADGLQIQKAITKEIEHRRGLISRDSYTYRTTNPDSEWKPNFDVESNEKEMRKLEKLSRKLGKAITKANMTITLDVTDSDYDAWL